MQSADETCYLPVQVFVIIHQVSNAKIGGAEVLVCLRRGRISGRGSICRTISIATKSNKESIEHSQPRFPVTSLVGLGTPRIDVGASSLYECSCSTRLFFAKGRGRLTFNQSIASSSDVRKHSERAVLRSGVAVESRVSAKDCPTNRKIQRWFIHLHDRCPVPGTGTSSVCSFVSLSVLTGLGRMGSRPVLFFRRRFLLLAVPSREWVTSSSYSIQLGT